MTGRHDVKRVSLDDSLMQEDKEILEDLIAAAVNDAVRKIEQNSQDKMSGMTSGMQLRPASRCLSRLCIKSRRAKVRRRRKRLRKRSLRVVNEHSEAFFNEASPMRRHF